ncbi:MAG: hypothetical protein Q4D16_10875 [Eubacteriales bacterium]|nr:hypothetical protein [Eubacteriales bacterium]
MKKVGCIILTAFLSFAFGITVGSDLFQRENKSISDKIISSEESERTWETKTLEPVKSKLADQKKCWLCGNDNRSLMGYFRKFNDVGIICTNSWYVLDFQVRNYDEAGNFTSEQDGSRSGWVSNGEGECSFYSNQMSGRGISEVTATYGENSYFDISKVQGHLCQVCLDKVLAVMETSGYEDEQAKPRDLCLVDFQTLELYPLQKQNIAYFVRDYYIMVESKEEETKVHAIYAPVLENGSKNIELYY